ncbi:hypothetical protein AAY473_004008 [Plecturocebus cupreus]
MEPSEVYVQTGGQTSCRAYHVRVLFGFSFRGGIVCVFVLLITGSLVLLRLGAWSVSGLLLLPSSPGRILALSPRQECSGVILADNSLQPPPSRFRQFPCLSL